MTHLWSRKNRKQKQAGSGGGRPGRGGEKPEKGKNKALTASGAVSYPNKEVTMPAPEWGEGPGGAGAGGAHGRGQILASGGVAGLVFPNVPVRWVPLMCFLLQTRKLRLGRAE